MTLEDPREVSFTHPDTHFQLIRSRSPVHVDGYKMGEPIGRVVCVVCWHAAWNVDAIDHAEDCPQRYVHSEWYRERH